MRALRRWLLMATLCLPIPMLAGCDGLNPEIAAKKAREAAQERVRARRTKAACGSQAAYERLKLVVFDHAIRLRNADRHNLDTLASYVAVRVEDPLVRHHDDTLDLTTCRGRLVLHIPPGAERAFGGKRMLVADVAYAAQVAADGSGPVYGIKGAEPIVASLAAFDVRWRAYRTQASDDRTMLAENDTPEEGLLPGRQANDAGSPAGTAALAATGTAARLAAEPLRAAPVQVAKALPLPPQGPAPHSKPALAASETPKPRRGPDRIKPVEVATASPAKPASTQRKDKPAKLAAASPPKPGAVDKDKRKQVAAADAKSKVGSNKSRPIKTAKASPPKPASRRDKPAKLAKASPPKPSAVAKDKRKQVAVADPKSKVGANKSRPIKSAKASSPKPTSRQAKPAQLAKASPAKSKQSTASTRSARLAKASPSVKSKPVTRKQPKVQVAKAPAREVSRLSKPERVQASLSAKRPVAQAKSTRVAGAVARPSFNCRNAHTRSQRMVCGDKRLASLDRRMASVYGRAFTGADPSTRAELRRSRARFLDYRNNCPTAGCVAQAYNDRMDEIQDIRAGL